MNLLSNITRPKGDPKILWTGPGSLTGPDRLARGLGWFSFGLGAIELFGAHRVARFLGLRGHEGLIRAFGAREIAAGMLTLSTEQNAGLVSRVAGDALDIAVLAFAMDRRNRQRENVALALATVVGVTLLDIAATKASMNRHARPKGSARDYGDRSGYPKGIQASRGAAAPRPRAAA